MAGTEQLHSANGEAKLAVLVEQVGNLRGDVSGVSTQVTELTTAFNSTRLDFTRQMLETAAQTNLNKAAIELLDKKIDHKAATSIDRDQQQVIMIRAEETIRKEAVGELTKAITATEKTVQALIPAYRILIFIGSALGASVIAFLWALITGQAEIVFTGG